MEWLIFIVIVVAALLGKAPSAVHDPSGYNSQQGCMTILSDLYLIGFVIGLAKACH